MSGGELSASDKQALVIKCYEALLARAGEMRELARAEEWSELIRHQAGYVVEVERLARMERDLELDADQRERKATLLEAILEHDREVRAKLVARRDELGQLIGTSQRRRDLSRAYRTGSGNQVVEGDYASASVPPPKPPGPP